jgi:hypothetical protein
VSTTPHIKLIDGKPDFEVMAYCNSTPLKVSADFTNSDIKSIRQKLVRNPIIFIELALQKDKIQNYLDKI